MPPKKAGPSKKTIEKAKTKIVEDKTFGLKNKNKSAKVQQYVQQVEKQVAVIGKTKADLKKEETGPKKSKAEIEREKKEELAKLLGIVQPKLEVGVDPKSVLCEYHRMGCCAKGDKCKYSHDLNVARKAEKIDLYTDRHEASKEAANKDSMAGWNQDELESVIEKRHGSTNKGLPPTTIVCKYFLDAVEQKRYGWFWSCPNGPTCHYRHCLPPGFVLKSEKKVEEVNPEDLLSLEDQIEQERALLETRTPVTHESFLAWKKKKSEERAKKEAAAEAERKKEIKSGKTAMSGREMFTFNPDLFVDDEGAGDADDYEREEDPDVQERIITVTGTSIGHRLKGQDTADPDDDEHADHDGTAEAADPAAAAHADTTTAATTLPDPNVCPQCARRMKGGAEAVRDHLIGKHQLSMEAAVAEVDRIAALVAAASAKKASPPSDGPDDSASSAPAAAAAPAAAVDAETPADVAVDEDLFDVDDEDDE